MGIDSGVLWANAIAGLPVLAKWALPVVVWLTIDHFSPRLFAVLLGMVLAADVVRVAAIGEPFATVLAVVFITWVGGSLGYGWVGHKNMWQTIQSIRESNRKLRQLREERKAGQW